MPSKTSSQPHQAFPPTRWSQLRQIGSGDADLAASALDLVCSAYRQPVYCYLRHEGRVPDEADELTQGFFAHVLKSGLLTKADPTVGKFRSLLLTALKNYAIGEVRRQRAAKRGGGIRNESLTVSDEEEGYRDLDIPTSTTPVELYDVAWARCIMTQTLGQVRAQYATKRKGMLFEELLGCLDGTRGDGRYQRLAEKLGISRDGVDSAVNRLSRQLGDEFRRVVSRTLKDPKDLDSEMDYLRNLLSM